MRQVRTRRRSPSRPAEEPATSVDAIERPEGPSVDGLLEAIDALLE